MFNPMSHDFVRAACQKYPEELSRLITGVDNFAMRPHGLSRVFWENIPALVSVGNDLLMPFSARSGVKTIKTAWERIESLQKLLTDLALTRHGKA